MFPKVWRRLGFFWHTKLCWRNENLMNKKRNYLYHVEENHRGPHSWSPSPPSPMGPIYWSNVPALLKTSETSVSVKPFLNSHYLHWWNPYRFNTFNTKIHVPWSYQLAKKTEVFHLWIMSEVDLSNLVTLIHLPGLKLLNLEDGGWSQNWFRSPPIDGVSFGKPPWSGTPRLREAKRPNKPLTLVKSEKSTTGGEAQQRKKNGKSQASNDGFDMFLPSKTWACK